MKGSNFTGCAGLCQEGTIGNSTGLTSATECLPCPAGHYCNATGLTIDTMGACPKGTVMPATGGGKSTVGWHKPIELINFGSSDSITGGWWLLANTPLHCRNSWRR